MERREILDPDRIVRHIDPRAHVGLEALLRDFAATSFQARNLARAAEICTQAVLDPDCVTILCLAGSLVSAGLKRTIAAWIEEDLVDVVVATGANVVDQDFFESLGFHHYQGDPRADDEVLRELRIDRIYDHYIDEDELRICDETVREILDGLEPRPHSSREIVAALGDWSIAHGRVHDGFVEACRRHEVPVFVPALSDSSAGFGFVMHQDARRREGRPMVSLDTARDFLELTYLKMHAARDSALIMVGGGVPKNFAQDTVVAAEVLGAEVPMHRYAVQLTVADERDGALSGSTLREASSWGKVATQNEQMVFGEASLTFPLLTGAVLARAARRGRRARRLLRHLRSDGSFDVEAHRRARAEEAFGCTTN